MKYVRYIIPLLLFTTFVSAQQSPGQNKNNNNNNSNNNQQQSPNAIQECKETIKLNKDARTTKPPQPLALAECENYAIVAFANSQTLIIGKETKTTVDGSISCSRDGGYTVDYNDCTRVLYLYDAVIVAEQGMYATQTVVVNESNKSASNKVAEENAKGNLQAAAIQATKDRNRLNAKLYTTQYATYSAAVAALSTQVIRWRGKKQLRSFCEKNKNIISSKAQQELGVADFNGADCLKSVTSLEEDELVFKNGQAKSQFTTAIVGFIKKANDARVQAGISEKVADLIPDPTKDDEETLLLNKCFTTPKDPACKTINSRNISRPDSFKGSQVDFGAGGAQTTFTSPDGSNALGPNSPSSDPTSGAEKVADINNPFEQAAKDANGILNPANAATMGPGQGAASGAAGGGAGGGGGGGGSASLGSDLAGKEADSNKDPEIKTGKYGNKYSSGKGAGFEAVGKGGKEDENPFASMFDANAAAGGIEEDNSIAAANGGEDSGIFRQISKKYGQVQQEMRIEQKLE